MAAQMAYRIQQLHRKFPAAAADDGGSHDASGAGRQRPDFDYPCIQYVCKQWSCIVADTQWHRQSADVATIHQAFLAPGPGLRPRGPGPGFPARGPGAGGPGP